MKTILLQCVLILGLVMLMSTSAWAAEEGSLEQQLLDMLVKNTIVAFEYPKTKDTMSQFSKLIKDENTYQFIIQKIDKFILTNEMDEYEDQAEALKNALTEMREFYIRSEQKTLEKYQDMKQQQQERDKQRDLKANNVIEV